MKKMLRSGLAAILVLFAIIAIPGIPATAAINLKSDTFQVIEITGTGINVRKTRSTSAASLGTVSSPSAFAVLGTATVDGKPWHEIVFGESSETGYIRGDNTTLYTSAKYEKAIVCTSDSKIIIRETAASNAKDVGGAFKGEVYQIIETKKVNDSAGNNDWYKITRGNIAGWVCGLYIRELKVFTEVVVTPATTVPNATVTSLGATLDRLYGDTRYATNIAICSKSYETSDFAVLVNGENFADALAGAPLAHMVKAPILLTKNAASLESTVLNQLKNLKTKTVYILGGTSVISDSIKKEIENAGMAAVRLAGSDRFATAVEIAKEMDVKRGKAIDTFVVADGRNFPDALSITPVAAMKGWPILFTPSDKSDLNASSEEYFKSKSMTKAVIIGGPGAVPAGAEGKLKELNVTVDRVYGDNRYWTSAAIATKYKSEFTQGGVAVVATGELYPDALSGSIFAAKNKAPLILLNGKGTSSVHAKNALLNTGAKTIYALGGASALSDGIIAAHAGPLTNAAPPVLTFAKGYYYVDQGQTVNVAITNAPGISITYSSVNAANAPVSSTGVVTGNAPGLYRITATGSGATGTTEVAVLAPKNIITTDNVVSPAGLTFLKACEGGMNTGGYADGNFHPYKDAGGTWTIGYGLALISAEASLITDDRNDPNYAAGQVRIRELFNEILGSYKISGLYTLELTETKPYLTQAEADSLLLLSMTRYSDAVNKWAKDNGVRLNQNQFDALFSLTYNLGQNVWNSDFYLKSAILAYRDGSLANRDQILEGFKQKTVSAGGLYFTGRWHRRNNEARLFLDGNYTLKYDYPLPSGINWVR